MVDWYLMSLVAVRVRPYPGLCSAWVLGQQLCERIAMLGYSIRTLDPPTYSTVQYSTVQYSTAQYS